MHTQALTKCPSYNFLAKCLKQILEKNLSIVKVQNDIFHRTSWYSIAIEKKQNIKRFSPNYYAELTAWRKPSNALILFERNRILTRPMDDKVLNSHNIHLGLFIRVARHI